jgi:hypothetical protein
VPFSIVLPDLPVLPSLDFFLILGANGAEILDFVSSDLTGEPYPGPGRGADGMPVTCDGVGIPLAAGLGEPTVPGIAGPVPTGLVGDWPGSGKPGRRGMAAPGIPAPAEPEVAGQAVARSAAERSAAERSAAARSATARSAVARCVVARSVEVSGQTGAGFTVPDTDAFGALAVAEPAEPADCSVPFPLLPSRSPATGLMVSTFRTVASSVPAALPDPSACRVTGSTRLSTRPPAHVLPRGYPVMTAPDPRLPRSSPW